MSNHTSLLDKPASNDTWRLDDPKSKHKWQLDIHSLQKDAFYGPVIINAEATSFTQGRRFGHSITPEMCEKMKDIVQQHYTDSYVLSSAVLNARTWANNEIQRRFESCRSQGYTCKIRELEFREHPPLTSKRMTLSLTLPTIKKRIYERPITRDLIFNNVATPWWWQKAPEIQSTGTHILLYYPSQVYNPEADFNKLLPEETDPGFSQLAPYLQKMLPPGTQGPIESELQEKLCIYCLTALDSFASNGRWPEIPAATAPDPSQQILLPCRRDFEDKGRITRGGWTRSPTTAAVWSRCEGSEDTEILYCTSSLIKSAKGSSMRLRQESAKDIARNVASVISRHGIDVSSKEKCHQLLDMLSCIDQLDQGSIF